MKKYFWIIFLLLTQVVAAQQVEDAWVYFTGKPQSATYLSNPLTMLSQRALDRRTRLNIALDIKDVPVDDNYVTQIDQSAGINVLAKSKWLNAVHVQGLQAYIQNLLSLGFVDRIEFANKNIGVITGPAPFVWTVSSTDSNRLTTFDYGAGTNQIQMLHGEVMHQQNYTGEGILLAVIDAGFEEVNTASLFQHLFQNNKIIDVYNFPDNNTNVYQRSMHGSGVLSTIAAKSNGVLVGTAPDVSVALYISEDVNQEMPIEESYWAEAAERADSLGVDVINTSLGYTTFDRADYNYTMADLDGQTSFVSRAATIAVSRGINVVVSAGNSGYQGSSWPKVGMPGDVATVITVGAVDANRMRASFSSIGPTADERIKPDVMAQGQGTAVYSSGQIQNLNGTSFSSPVMAGMVACMVQAYPNKTPAEIKQDLISISDRFNNPDNEYGFGIPDFSQYQIVSVTNNDIKSFQLYPNPAQDVVYVNSDEPTSYQLFNLDGKLVKQGQAISSGIDISRLVSGVYFFKMKNHTQKLIIK